MSKAFFKSIQYCTIEPLSIVTADILMLSLERNSVLSELTFQHFQYDFKAMRQFKIAEKPHTD